MIRWAFPFRSLEFGTPPPVTWNSAVWNRDAWEDSGLTPIADRNNLADIKNPAKALANLGAGSAGRKIFEKATRQEVLEYLDPPRGDMKASIYDPKNHQKDVYDLGNATGTLPHECLPQRLQQRLAVVYIQADDPGPVGAGAIWIIP